MKIFLVPVLLSMNVMEDLDINKGNLKNILTRIREGKNFQLHLCSYSSLKI